MELIEEKDEYYDGESPSGSNRDGYTTYSEPATSPLAQAIREHFATKTTYNAVDRGTRHEQLRLTVHNCWSGYSEYTITSTWDEITINWGPYEAHFGSMPEFFRALGGLEAAA